MPSVLLNFGTVGVSKAAFRFADPVAERRGTGVFGTIPSSLCPLSQSAQSNTCAHLHPKYIIPLTSTPWCSESSPLIHATNVRFPSGLSLQHLLQILLESSDRR